ncbi:MAG: acylphosphatase [Gammaproteobacteria bacterium]|nr:acylphosphatase [Gammaproteobacteria bacterium]MBT8110243.1 acylphosphatase [Gammaproteobacteria bacterium]NND48163.1 acylphosphatase [Woeseiaceae bacterium]NNL44946.1 acylphosphatase [Woeseiaceae bacterium]
MIPNNTGSAGSRHSARRFSVSGRVQGVWFRDSTRREAERLGITGHAINLDNGDVEVFACGSEEALDALYRWLLHGPPLADVSAVEQSPAQHEALHGFRIG